MRIISATATVIVVLLLFPSAGFSSFRCGNAVITEGDTKPEVLAQCGAPDWVESGFAPVPTLLYQNGSPPPVNIRAFWDDKDRWFYNFGVNDLLHVITFEKGIVVDVRTRGYGYLDLNRLQFHNRFP